jgi:hypothetical protein
MLVSVVTDPPMDGTDDLASLSVAAVGQDQCCN